MKYKNKLQIFVACIFLLIILIGCSEFSVREEKTADELAQDGMAFFEDGDYKKALANFDRLRDWYPFSKYVTLAELRSADCYYELEDYASAIFEYEEFNNLHPKNEAIPYVISQTGLCYFEQLTSIDRDQLPAEKAIESYKNLLEQFPDSEYADNAKENIKISRNNLAGHELSIGKFYYKTGKYKAALFRFRTVVSEYPDSEYYAEAVAAIPKCERKVQQQTQEDQNKEDQNKED